MKKQKFNEEYFTKVINLMGKEMLTTQQMYDVLISVGKEIGLPEMNIAKISQPLNKVLEVLGSEVEAIDDETTKGRGRLHPKIYSLKSVESALQKVKDHFASDGIKKPRKKPTTYVFTRPRRDTAQDVYNLLRYMEINKMGCVDLEVIAKCFNSNFVSKKMVEGKFETLNGFGVRLNATFTPCRITTENAGCKRVLLTIENPGQARIILYEAAKKWYTEPLEDVEIFTENKNLTPVKNPSNAISTKIKNDDEDYILFIISGIIQYEMKSIDLIDLMTCLKKQFTLNLSRQDILDLISKEDELTLINNSTSVYFARKESGKILFDKYDPRKQTKTIYFRMGASLNFVQTLFSDAEICSPISQNDNIYKITINRSQHCRSKLIQLYRTFRDNDMIFGEEELVHDLSVQAKVMVGVWNGRNACYQIERMLS